MPDHVEALVLLGDLGRASALLGPFQERARRLNRRCALLAAQRCRALLLTAAGQPGTALPELLAAMAALGRPAEPIEYGRCLLAAGRIQRRLRTKKAALTSLGDALAAFAATGAACWAAQAQTEIARLGPRAIGPRELIHSERQVADLAARGLTNREVARALFVSTKTVDATLSRVYRKLGMRSRTELAWHQGEGARGDPAATGPRAAGPGRDHGGPRSALISTPIPNGCRAVSPGECGALRRRLKHHVPRADAPPRSRYVEVHDLPAVSRAARPGRSGWPPGARPPCPQPRRHVAETAAGVPDGLDRLDAADDPVTSGLVEPGILDRGEFEESAHGRGDRTARRGRGGAGGGDRAAVARAAAGRDAADRRVGHPPGHADLVYAYRHR